MFKGGNNGFSAGVVILAAGASRRMGEPKLLLPWGKTSVLGHLLQRWAMLEASQIAVVCATGAVPMIEELDRLGVPAANRIFNATPDNGMFSSIQCAAAWPGWNSSLTHWLVTLGDQPQLSTATLRKLLEFGAWNPEKICQPMRAGRRKHPVLLPRALFAELKESSAGDLRMFLVEHAKELSGFESDDAGLDFDMDTREDYEKLQRDYG
ncbi:MAG TPA: nucleotidyltransferase family protein [Verrucomicrobiae bacterium]|nr:nucleotidyltransferase family protein [Verrucomicrobiae bacterium]